VRQAYRGKLAAQQYSRGVGRRFDVDCGRSRRGGDFVDSGRAVMLGVVPTTAPTARPSAEEIAKAVVAVTDRLGSRDPCCATESAFRRGVAGGRHPAVARTAVELAQKAADAFAEDPDAI